MQDMKQKNIQSEMVLRNAQSENEQLKREMDQLD